MHFSTSPKSLRRFAAAALFAISTLLTSVMAQAQAAWPAKPIKWIIPYPPGGITDSATRMVVQKVQEQTGWTIVIENKPYWAPILPPRPHLMATLF